MKINPLYNPYDDITIESYLEKCGVDNPKEYLKGGFNNIEPCKNYDNIDCGYKMLFDSIKDLIKERG